MPSSSPPSLDDATLAQHRPALLAHCYRMLGSPFDADDAAQETLIRAERGHAGFEGRASLRTWLLRIATRVCLDELARRQRRRERPTLGPPGHAADPITMTPAERWVEPVPEAWVLPSDATPDQVLATRQGIRLAFVAALQHLPPRQRAALLLTEVLGGSAREAASALDTTVPALNSLVQRARRTLAAQEGRDTVRWGELDAASQRAVERYAAAFEAFDIDAIEALLDEDIAFCMPPIPLWLDRPDQVAAFMRGTGAGCAGSRLVPVAASGRPAFGQYKRDGAAWGLVVVEAARGRIVGIDTFLDTARLFPIFGLPPSLSA